MPIITPSTLPINGRLAAEGINVMSRDDATHQDIRAQEIAIVNLMPDKQNTERQLARLLGHTALHLNLTLIHTASHRSKNTSQDHLRQYYNELDDISSSKFDGLIVTGAPVEDKDWDKVDYWTELQSIMDWSRENVTARLYICWGAQAALHHQYGIEKQPLAEKAFGIFPHEVLQKKHPLVAGFDDEFFVPVSRHTEIRTEDVAQIDDLDILSTSNFTGLYLAQTKDGRDTFMMNHPEYGKNTLRHEYERDVRAGKSIKMPYNYFPGDNPEKCPVNHWRAHARLLYANWLNDYVYARTPFDLQSISSDKRRTTEEDFQI